MGVIKKLLNVKGIFIILIYISLRIISNYLCKHLIKLINKILPKPFKIIFDVKFIQLPICINLCKFGVDDFFNK